MECFLKPVPASAARLRILGEGLWSRRRDAEDAPQAAGKSEAVLRAVEEVSGLARQPAGHRQYVEVARRPEAAERADLEGQRVVAEHQRVVLPRLEVPMVSEQREAMLTRMARCLGDAEAHVGSGPRLEDRRQRVARRRVAAE